MNYVSLEKRLIKINSDLSLVTYLFSEIFHQGFSKQEIQCKNGNYNAKYFHTYSRERLNYSFSADNNSSITTICMCKTIPRFRKFTAKVYLVHRDGY